MLMPGKLIEYEQSGNGQNSKTTVAIKGLKNMLKQSNGILSSY